MLYHESYDFAELLLNQRFAQAFAEGAASYPIHRRVHYAARMPLQRLFDAIALSGHWRAQRIDDSHILLDADGVFISGTGTRKNSYCTVAFEVWAAAVDVAETSRRALLAQAGESRITEPMFAIDWNFVGGRGGLRSVTIEECADAPLDDLAYPELVGGVGAFINRYLDADETVLVLQGPPGTGKTRLIRAILAQMSRRKGSNARALYTGDRRALESDEIYVEFITGHEDAFVIEDADHVLKPRSEGNEDLHRFLGIADGVVRAQGRKIIFSTNLPNMGDLDDALVRPGRCFGHINVRPLNQAEVVRLLAKLLPDPTSQALALTHLCADRQSSFPLAEVYAAVTAARNGSLRLPLVDAPKVDSNQTSAQFGDKSPAVAPEKEMREMRRRATFGFTSHL